MCSDIHAFAYRDACRGCGFARYEMDAEILFRVDRVIVVHGSEEYLHGASGDKDPSVLGR